MKRVWTVAIYAGL